ncbi:MAG TPA: tetratricopeptide repeat protein [Tepidisphaeraceae bacterium]|nr:tetratricopeptide repeat protein [Tepidisphaeraceae bacterium]
MKPANQIIIVTLCLFGVATARCGAQPRPEPSPATAAAPASASAQATLSLDEIQPAVSFPNQPSRIDDEPPLESLHLYAQARIAWMDRDRSGAIGLLEQAAALDPHSFYLHSTLGRMYRNPGVEFSDPSIRALEKAAALEPDHLDLQMDLGRQLEAKGDIPGAIKHLRMALLTRAYRADPASAAVAEFFLGNLLRTQGYDRAALELYQRLSVHLKSPQIAAEPSREVALLLNQADVIDMEIAEMLARCGKFPEALAAFQTQIERNPGTFDLRSTQVHLLVALKRNDDAVIAAQKAVVRFRASAESIALLNEACVAAGHAGGAVGVLTSLHKDHPADRSILFALADTLRADKKGADAERVLATSAVDDPGDLGIVRRRFELAMDRQDNATAARLLIEANSKRQDLATLIAPLWARLSAPIRTGRFRYSDLVKLDVPESQDAAKWFWVARLASAARRDDVSQSALERSAGSTPAFAPAFRDLVDDVAGRGDLDGDEKEADVAKIIGSLKGPAGASLADELRGLWLFRKGDAAQAATIFARVISSGVRSIDLSLERAQALRAAGEDDAADSLLWKLVSDHPETREAYQNLCLSSWRRGLDQQAERALTIWLAADPQDVMAWRFQSIAYQRAKRDQAAEAILTRLLNEHGDEPEVIDALDTFYKIRYPADRVIELFTGLHARFPTNYAIGSILAESLVGADRPADAMKIADGLHAGAGDDAELLYAVSALYAKIGNRQSSEITLEEALKLDPKFPGAANDLGYLWTEDGRKLAEAQTLIEQAVAAEPHNVSFLDSMGWVLYKQGNFVEARKYLDRAIGTTNSARTKSDPALLDHRGDTLYRIGAKDAAAADWEGAADRLAALKEDDAGAETKNLREKLMEKIRRLKAGEDVVTAPIAAP